MNFADRVYFRMSESGFPIFISSQLTRLWPLGHSVVQDVSFETCAYVARYTMKKVAGSRDEQDRLIMKDSGEILSPEYLTMSRRPGVGTAWYKQFRGDVYPVGSRIVRGRDMQPPKFYDLLYSVDDPVGFEELKISRQNSLDKSDNVLHRLAVKEECAVARLKLHPRD